MSGVAALLGVGSSLSIPFRSGLRRRRGLVCRGRKRSRLRSSSGAADRSSLLRLRARPVHDILEGVPGVSEPALQQLVYGLAHFQAAQDVLQRA